MSEVLISFLGPKLFHLRINQIQKRPFEPGIMLAIVVSASHPLR